MWSRARDSGRAADFIGDFEIRKGALAGFHVVVHLANGFDLALGTFG